jgi:predicted AAA+ superfamily ATPase
VAILQLSSLSQSERQGIDSVPFSVDREALLKRQNNCELPSVTGVFEWILQGGMPALVSGKHKNTQIYFSSYLESYIERDIRDISSGLDTFRFLDFIRAAAVRTAQVVNYSGLARDCGVNEKTAKNWLLILEALGLVFLLHPFSNNALTRTVKSPKLYFSDTGLAAYLACFADARSLEVDSLSGAFFENYAVSEMVKSYQNSAQRSPLYFYRDARQTEIDVVIDSGRKLSPVEIKQSIAPGRSAFSAFAVLEKTGRKGAGAVICNAQALEDFDLDNMIVPVGLI